MLTDKQCKAIKPEAKTKRYSDGKSMFLEVRPNGSKYFFLAYRYGGKQKRISLGVYPEISLKEAREKTLEYRKRLKAGEDIVLNKQNNKYGRTGTFEALAREWLEGQKEAWVKSHYSRVVSSIERDVFPLIGHLPINTIKAPDVLAAIRNIENRGKNETAHRTLQKCSQVFRFAVSLGLIDHDPTQSLKGALKPYQTKHHPAFTEEEDVAELLKAIDEYSGSGPQVKAALQLAPLVFVRPGELRQAEWAHINLESGLWSFEASKTKKQHIVPLARQAIQILKGLHPFTGHGRFVFPNFRTPNGSRPITDATLTRALRTMGFSKEEVVVHGFRATARTLIAEKLKYRPEIIEQQLAHEVKDYLGRAYNRTQWLDERREMMQAYADYLDFIKRNPLKEGIPD